MGVSMTEASCPHPSVARIDRSSVTLGSVELNGIDAVQLGMGGTLVDSDAAVERAWTVWAQRHGVEVAALTGLHGSPADHTIRRLLPTLGPDAVARSAAEQLELQYDDVADVVATPGAHRVVEELGRSGL